MSAGAGAMGVLCTCLTLVSGLVAVVVGAAAILTRRVLLRLPPLQKGTVAFFHPFADGGGGGERVLWCAVQAVQQAAPHVKVYIYSREGSTAEKLSQDASRRFNITLTQPIHVVPLANTAWVLPERYPRFTLLGQSWGAAKLGYEALSKLVPELFIDTTGWASTFPLARLAGSRVACYVHYPTISSDMIGRVASGAATYNNSADISGSRIKSFVKLLYYRVFALMYGLTGAFSQATMVNSSWTRNHIQHLWWGHGTRSRSSSSPARTFSSLTPSAGAGAEVGAGGGGRVALVYPPCDTEDLQKLRLDRKLKQLYLVSVAQFRPEKNHRLQLEAFARVKKLADEGLEGDAIRVAKLKMVGGCRDAADEARLRDLQRLASELGVASDVEWCVNAPYAELKALLAEAVGGVHSMIDEHFGICVVEYMAAGVIPIAHNSGGPRADIVVPVPAPETMAAPPPEQRMGMDAAGLYGVAAGAEAGAGLGSTWGTEGEGGRVPMQRTGFLATTVEEYAEAMRQVLVMDQRARLQIAAAAQRHASKFSTQRFLDGFTSVIAPVLPKP